MKQSELYDTLADKTGVSKADVQRVMTEFQETVMNRIGAGDDVVMNFGIFKPKTNAARKGRNPQTGAEIDIPESQSARFQVGNKFKNFLN